MNSPIQPEKRRKKEREKEIEVRCREKLREWETEGERDRLNLFAYLCTRVTVLCVNVANGERQTHIE